MEADVLLQDTRYVILEQAVAEGIARGMSDFMYRQAHPFKAPFKDAERGRVNQYGGKGIVKFDPTTDDTNAGIRQQITLVDWSSPDGYARACTIDVGRIRDGGGGTFPAAVNAAGMPLSYRPNAQVIYGTPAGLQNPFFVDINRGQRFTVTASYVAVTAQMSVPGVFPVQYASGSELVIGNLGVGTTPSLAPVFFTQFFDVDPFQAVLLHLKPIIPEKANRIMPIRTSNGSSLHVDILDNAGFVIDTLGLVPSGSMITPADLPDDAYQLDITPTVLGTSFRLIYQISV